MSCEVSRLLLSITMMDGSVPLRSRLPSHTKPSNRRYWQWILAAEMIFFLACGLTSAYGQNASSALPQDTPHEYTSLKRFPQNLGGNFLAIFSRKNIVPLLVGSASTGVISIWDQDIKEHFSVQNGSSSIGKTGSALGSLAVVAPVVGGLLIAGNRSQNDRFRSFSYSLAQGLVIDQGINQGLKFATDRTRPDKSNDQSFPSGHASTSFMIATTLQRYYGWKAGILGYGFASFISIARMRDNKHWASDVTAGATLGYIVGSSVSRRTGLSIRGAKLTIAPTIAFTNRTVGVILTLN